MHKELVQARSQLPMQRAGLTLASLRYFLRIAHVIAREDLIFLFRRVFPLPIRWLLRIYGFPLRLLGRVGDRDTFRRRPGERLARGLTRLGPSYIKLGQIFSVRKDLVGSTFAKDLSQLQDRLPPEPNAKAILEAAFEKPLHELFATFDDKAVAAASVAQVHKAVTHEGETVAVKILRPNMLLRFREDYRMLKWIARIQERYYPQLSALRLSDSIETWWRWSRQELDLRQEGANLAELAHNMLDEKDIRFPKVYFAYSRRNVLVTEWIDGARLTDVETLNEWGISINDIFDHSLRLFFLQVFRDGFFHADIHPGNLFVSKEGLLIPIDFGIMGRVSQPLRYFIIDSMLGFIVRDYVRVARAYERIGILPAGQSLEEFASACRAVGETLFSRGKLDVSYADFMLQFVTITDRFDIEAQTQLLLVQKTILQAEGVGAIISPETNIWEGVMPMMEEYIRNHLHPVSRVRRSVSELQEQIGTVPVRLKQVEQAILDLSSEFRRAPSAPPPRKNRLMIFMIGVAVGVALNVVLRAV